MGVYTYIDDHIKVSLMIFTVESCPTSMQGFAPPPQLSITFDMT